MYPLTPIVHSDIQLFIDEKNRIVELSNAFGSPLNILFPEHVRANIDGFESVFKQAHVNGCQYYAHKANKSSAILQEIAMTRAGVDVASVKEFQHALSCGIRGKRIVVTGPKNRDLLRLSMQHQAIISIDNLQELQEIITLSTSMQLDVSVSLRMHELSSAQEQFIQKDTKFGMNNGELQQAITILAEYPSVQLQGLSMHIATSSTRERTIAAEQLLRLAIEVMEQGADIQWINIGGGYSINFLESEKEWHAYTTALQQSILYPQKYEQMTWNSTGLGYWAENNRIRGSALFSEFYQSQTQFDQLARLLTHHSTEFGMTIGQVLRENMLSLSIEPGRSLLDQVGITVAKVMATKKSAQGETLVIVDMNRAHMNAQELEYMCDPLHIPVGGTSRQKTERGMYIVGHLCLPHDIIMRHKVYLRQIPQAGDLLVFINTAGYFMDFSESETLQQPIAKKLAVRCNSEITSRYQWYTDEQYQPQV